MTICKLENCKSICALAGRLLQLPLGLRDHSHNLAGTSALDQRQVHDRQFYHTFTLWYSCCTSDHSQNCHFLKLEPCLQLWLLRCQRFWIAGSSFDQRQFHDRQFFHTFTLWYSFCTFDHSQNCHFLNLEPCLHLWLLRCQRFWIAGSSFDQQ